MSDPVPSKVNDVHIRVRRAMSFFSAAHSYTVNQLLHDFEHSFLKILYGDEFDENKELLLRETGYNIPFETNVHYDVHYEEDMLIAMYKWVAICLVTLEDHETTIYADSRRTGKVIMKKIMGFVQQLQKQFGGRTVAANKNENVYFETNEGFTNYCHCYLATKETLRGTEAKTRTGTIFVMHPGLISKEVVSTILEASTSRSSVNVIRLSLREDGELHSDSEKSS